MPILPMTVTAVVVAAGGLLAASLVLTDQQVVLTPSPTTQPGQPVVELGLSTPPGLSPAAILPPLGAETDTSSGENGDGKTSDGKTSDDKASADDTVEGAIDTDPKTLYVSPEIGDDTNDGQTLETPWRSLQKSLDQLQPGQTLFLMDGSYAGPHVENPAHFVVRVDGTPEAWIRVAAAPGHHPVLRPDNGNGLVVKDADYIEVAGLTVEGDGFGPDNSYGWGLLVRNSHHVRFVGNTVSDMPVGGISSVESANLAFVANTVHDNSFWGTEQGSGISIWHSRDHGFGSDDDGYHDRVIGNVTYRNENKVYSRWNTEENIITDGNGIIIDESREFDYSGRTLVANNVAFDNGGRGIVVTAAQHVDVLHNTTYLNGRTTELTSAPTEMGTTRSNDVRFLNNLAVSRPGTEDFRVSDGTGIISGGNIFITDNPAGMATELDLVTPRQPRLAAPDLDPDLADFRPLPGSPAVDGGVPLPGLRLLFDFTMGTRSDPNPDVGAFELPD